MLRGIHQYLSDLDDIFLVSSNRFCLILDIFFSVAMLNLREGLNEKKRFTQALPELPNPPPHDPNLGNLVLFLWKSKFKI